MFGGRFLAGAFRNVEGTSAKLMSYQKQWRSNAFAFSSRASILTASSAQQKYSGGRFTDPNLISRRFFSHGSGNSDSGTSSLKNALLAAIGGLLAIGSGAVYRSMVDDKSIFAGYYLAHCGPCDNPCAGKDGEGGGGEPPCVEKKCEDSPCLRKLDCEEQNIIKANGDLERVLKDVKSKAIEYTEAAMKAYCEAIDLMQQFLNQGYCVIDNDDLEPPAYEESWCCVYDIAKKRCEKVRDALEKGQCAWELLCRLREVVEAGKACKYTKCNPLLCIAEEALGCAEKELLALKSKLDCITSDHEMAEQYKQVIEDFKKDLQVDIEPMKECCEIKYQEQEVALMINAAYKRVVRAQKEMAQVLVCTGKVPERLQQTCC